MRILERDNAHKHLFVIAVGFTLLTVSLYVGVKLNAVGAKSVTNSVLLVLMTFAFGFSFLSGGAWWKRRKRPSPTVVKERADALLKMLAASKVGGRLTDGTDDEISIWELIEGLDKHQRDQAKDGLRSLFEDTPARSLPRTYRDIDTHVLDWHEYDLCIAVADEELPFAESICELLKEYRLRIHLPKMIGIDHDKVMRNVFYGGSKKCLALISAHVRTDGRSKQELNEAMRRAEQINDQYLMAVGIDRGGREFMRTEKLLAKYARTMKGNLSKEQLLEIISQQLLVLINPSPRKRELPDLLQTQFAVAVSYSNKHHVALAVIKELEGFLSGEEIFEYHRYAHLAVSDWDLRLQKVFHEQAELVVVFSCAPYIESPWCMKEWRAIRDLSDEIGPRKPMLLKFGQTQLPGVYRYDGVVECDGLSPRKIAELIVERLAANRRTR